jgi:hypothetical protein
MSLATVIFGLDGVPIDGAPDLAASAIDHFSNLPEALGSLGAMMPDRL